MSNAPTYTPPEGYPYPLEYLAHVARRSVMHIEYVLDSWREPFVRQRLPGVIRGVGHRWYSQATYDRVMLAFGQSIDRRGRPTSAPRLPEPSGDREWTRDALVEEFGLTSAALTFVLAWYGLDRVPDEDQAQFWGSVYEFLTDHVWTAQGMAEELGVARTTVGRTIEGSRFTQDFLRSPGQGSHPARFSIAAFAYVWQETAKVHGVEQATADWVKLVDVARVLKMGINALTDLLAGHPELELGPIQDIRFGPRIAKAMKRAAFRKLRKIVPEPAPRGWYVPAQLGIRTGWSRDKIVGHSARLECRQYRNPVNVLEYADHYRLRDVVQLLGKKPKVKPHGGWLTARAIRDAMNREFHVDHKWLMAHIDHGLSEPRVAINGVILDHWPPEELPRLLAYRRANPPRIGRPPKQTTN